MTPEEIVALLKSKVGESLCITSYNPLSSESDWGGCGIVTHAYVGNIDGASVAFVCVDDGFAWAVWSEGLKIEPYVAPERRSPAHEG